MKIRRNPLPSARIEMMPLIDIVFLLLVFFIYAMLSMAVHYSQPVDLPVSDSAVINPQEAISITLGIDKGGVELFVNDEPVVSMQQLSEEVSRRIAGTGRGMDSEVQIFADKSVSYQQLFAVLDAVRRTGLTRIALQADPVDRQP